jgi:hypothetical protein
MERKIVSAAIRSVNQWKRKYQQERRTSPSRPPKCGRKTNAFTDWSRFTIPTVGIDNCGGERRRSRSRTPSQSCSQMKPRRFRRQTDQRGRSGTRTGGAIARGWLSRTKNTELTSAKGSILRPGAFATTRFALMTGYNCSRKVLVTIWQRGLQSRACCSRSWSDLSSLRVGRDSTMDHVFTRLRSPARPLTRPGIARRPPLHMKPLPGLYQMAAPYRDELVQR